MRIEEALTESDLGSAKRPFYNMPVDPAIDKVIISVGMFEDLYVAHADSGKRVQYMDDNDIPPWKYHGLDDWEPIILNRPVEETIEETDVQKSDSSVSTSGGDEQSTEALD